MKIRYRYRFYPTEQQKKTLARVFGSCRFVYNWALRLRTDAWANGKKKIDYHQTSAMLTKLKRKKDTRWLQELSCVPPQQALRHLQTAFLNFWNKTTKYPTFKSKRKKQAAEYTSKAFKWDAGNKNLTVSGLGHLRIRWSREFQSVPTTVTITKNPSGRYFVTLCLDEKIESLSKTRESIGIDLGVSRLATLSNGERISNPRYLARNLDKLKRLQRIHSRRKKGSGRRERARLKIARLQEHIADCRADTLNKITTDLVRRFDVISIEDLNVRGMVRNHRLARAISDVGMGIFRQMLTYKCLWYEKELRVVDRFFPSSKRCFSCGHIVESLPLSIREWTCPECNATHDRDENAAKNIAGGHSVSARGGKVRRSRASARKRTSQRNVNHLKSPI